MSTSPPPSGSSPDVHPGQGAKLALRDQIMTARGRLSLAEIAGRARALASVLLDTPEVRRAATLTCYVSVGREPGTGPLLGLLQQAGKRVIVPVLQPDMDLRWAEYAGPGSLAPARLGLLQPTAPALPADAVATADAVLVPGLAVGRTGMRLGRGGGSYDRALARVPVGTFTCVLLNSEELLPDVPAEPHDRPVTAAATELALTRFQGRA